MASKLLLDTHSWIWAIEGSPRLPQLHAQAIADPANEVFISSISVWEIAIKTKLGKLRVNGDIIAQSIADGFAFLPFSVEAALEVGTLPLHHNDPFDRALLAQARADRLTLITSDLKFKAYESEVKLHWM